MCVTLPNRSGVGWEGEKLPGRGRRSDNITFTFASCTFNCPRGITTHRKPKIKSKNQMKKKKKIRKTRQQTSAKWRNRWQVCVCVLSVCEHYSVGLKDLCRLVVDLSRVCVLSCGRVGAGGEGAQASTSKLVKLVAFWYWFVSQIGQTIKPWRGLTRAEVDRSIER